jgi:hypothetical protein
MFRKRPMRYWKPSATGPHHCRSGGRRGNRTRPPGGDPPVPAKTRYVLIVGLSGSYDRSG